MLQRTHALRPAPTTRLVAAAAAAVAALATVTLAPGDTARAATAPAPITKDLFGVHHQDLHADGQIGWPQAPVGSVRMWDNKASCPR